MAIIYTYNGQVIREASTGKWFIEGGTPPGPVPVVPIPGTADILGLTYNTVQIGNRIWTCQNFEFATTTDANNAGFNGMYSNYRLNKLYGSWVQACSYSGTNNYSWGWMPAAISQFTNALTDGWRVPTETDWLDLFSKTDQEGLRNTRSDNWDAGAGTNYWYFNADGYCGSYGGYFAEGQIIRPASGLFNAVNKSAKAYWTSSEDDSNYRIAYITTDVNFNNGSLLGVYNWGKDMNAPNLSVRLVKDAV